MTPNDALTHLQRSHRHSYNSNTVTTSSFRRRLTRSPSPAFSFDSQRGRKSYSPACSYSSDSDSSSVQMSKRRHATTKPSTNGHANGIPHVPEEEATDELIPNDAKDHPPKTKIDWEIPRKLLHSSIGFLTLSLYTSGHSTWPVIEVLSASLVVVVSAEFMRFKSRRFEALYEKCLGFLMRESEKDKINGVVWYLCGVLFALVFYPIDVAVVSILILSWADTAASTFGRLWGSQTPKLPSASIQLPIPFVAASQRPRIGFAPRKSTAGFIASATTGFLIATSFWGYFTYIRQTPPYALWNCLSMSGDPKGLLGIGLITGLISGVVEALDLFSMDDNLTLPILSGAAIWVTLKLLC